MTQEFALSVHSTRQRLGLSAGKRLMRSRMAWRLAQAAAPGPLTTKPHDRVLYEFYLKLGHRLYTDRSVPVLWSNLLVPCELLWGMGLAPFYPETAAGIATGLRLSPLGVEAAEAAGYPIDLCTFNRCAAGLYGIGLYPQADAYVATSNVCDASSQLLAGIAHAKGRPFYFLDVPQSTDQAAVTYLTAQLKALIERCTTELDIRFDLDRLRQAIRLSNNAREFALDVAALREAHPAPLRGSALLSQLGMLTTMFGHPDGVTYYKALLDYTQERIQRADPEQPKQALRLYWMHLGPFYPSDLVPHLEYDLGAAIAFEEMSTVWWSELDEEQPLRSLAQKMLAIYLNGPVERRAALALSHIERYQCVGAIHFSHWGCRQSTGALRVLRTRLRRAGIPLLELDGDCVDPVNLQLGPLRTRVDAFVEMLS